MKKEKTVKALHIFLNYSPHLFLPIATFINEHLLAHKVALCEVSRHEKFKKGAEKLSSIMEDRYFGKLKLSLLQRITAKFSLVFVLTHRILPEFSLASYLKLIMGPTHIIIHGRDGMRYNLFSLILLKLFGKRFYLIHWGGKPYIGRVFRLLDIWNYKCFSHIFVLMSPEIEYFKEIVGDKVSCLPYVPGRINHDKIVFNEENSSRILLGNSAHHRENYREILDRLRPEDWKKITCMLNYGDHDSVAETDAFVKRYQEKFGDAFFAWRTTLPLEEYRKVLEESSFYVCIARTQTGLGAIYNSIVQGKTLILRGDNLKWVRELGVKAYDYGELMDLSFQTLNNLRLTEEEVSRTIRNFEKNLMLKYTKDYWVDQILSIIGCKY